MDEVEIPQYFVCPISLQIMKDPVTAITGITYDRESIEHWLSNAHNTQCPVTKQLLPRDSHLTPNHTLRRLIHSWCTQNSFKEMPASKSPLDKACLLSLMRDLWQTNLQLQTLRKLEACAADQDEKHWNCMVEAGVIKAMAVFISACSKRGETRGLQEALTILYHFIRGQRTETNLIFVENDEIVDAFTWVLGQHIDNHAALKGYVLLIFDMVIGSGDSCVLERLKPEFFKRLVDVLGEGISLQGTNAALQVMLEACTQGRNRVVMVDAGAVFRLVEMELGSPGRRTSELILGILSHLCSCADGRAKLLSHAAGIAIVAKRLLKISPAASEWAVSILSMVCKFSGTPSVLQEVLGVGGVTKLCMVLQVDCSEYVKDKAKKILRAHSDTWKNSPCIDVSTLLSKV